MARRLPGLRIRPGSVRLARQEAGLSLGGVARQDLSRTAIFLIEKGKTNPTLPTLELISERTGKPISFFLDDETAPAPARIDYAEIEHLLATEHLARVLELTKPLLAARQPRADLARLRFLRGQAHIRMADADSAEPLLLAARQHYEVSGDELMAVECLSWEVHVPYLREDPVALALAEAALARCRHLPAAPIQTEVRIVARIAGIHAARREWPKAVTRFEEAIELLGPVKDLHRMAAVYTDLGGVYRDMGKLDVAARYLQRAIALHEIVDDQRSLAMAENNLGLALMNMSNYASAQTHLDRAMEILEQVGIQRGRSHVLLSISELHLQRGALDTSERFG